MPRFKAFFFIFNIVMKSTMCTNLSGINLMIIEVCNSNKNIKRRAVILLILAHLNFLYSLFFYTFRSLFYIISESG